MEHKDDNEHRVVFFVCFVFFPNHEQFHNVSKRFFKYDVAARNALSTFSVALTPASLRLLNYDALCSNFELKRTS